MIKTAKYLTGKWLKPMKHVMTRYGEVHNSIHLCNILILDAIFCSSAAFYQRYMNNLQRRVNIGQKKSSLLFHRCYTRPV